MSIGVVAGLRLVFNHIKVNNLLEDVRFYASTVIHSDYNVNTNEFIPNTDYALKAKITLDNPPLLAIDTFSVEKEVCRLAWQKSHSSYTIKVNDILDGECSSDQENKMTFIFDAQSFLESVCAGIDIKEDCLLDADEKNKYG